MSLALDLDERLADHGRLIPLTRPLRVGPFRKLTWLRRPSRAERDAFRRGLIAGRAGAFDPFERAPAWLRGYEVGEAIAARPALEWLPSRRART
jgi:hypothetical protein